MQYIGIKRCGDDDDDDDFSLEYIQVTQHIRKRQISVVFQYKEKFRQKHSLK